MIRNSISIWKYFNIYLIMTVAHLTMRIWSTWCLVQTSITHTLKHVSRKLMLNAMLYVDMLYWRFDPLCSGLFSSTNTWNGHGLARLTRFVKFGYLIISDGCKMKKKIKKQCNNERSNFNQVLIATRENQFSSGQYLPLIYFHSIHDKMSYVSP